eukprot:9841350-Prorocentrum_lima.AAC.1
MTRFKVNALHEPRTYQEYQTSAWEQTITRTVYAEQLPALTRAMRTSKKRFGRAVRQGKAA